MSDSHATDVQSGDLFVRNATGLVRGVTPVSSVIINYIPGKPGARAGLRILPRAQPLPWWQLPARAGDSDAHGACVRAYSFGLLTAAMPRSGGDYLLVSRVIHPVVGVISSFYMQLSNGMFSTALGGWFFTTLALGPGLIVIGLVGDYPTLTSGAIRFSLASNWQFGIGVVVIIVSLLPFLTGWRSWIGPAGHRLHHHDGWPALLDGDRNLYLGEFLPIELQRLRARHHRQAGHVRSGHHDRSKAGVVTDPAFSFSKTLPMVAFVAAFGIYSYFTSFVGGELRQGGTVKTAHRMALGGVLEHRLGWHHRAHFSFTLSVTPSWSRPTVEACRARLVLTPTYFFRTAAQLGSVAVAVFLVVSFALFWPLLTAIAFLQPTRMLFAYSFDGLLPKSVAKVSGKSHAPVAVAISGVLSIATLAWAIYLASVFQVVTYIVLAQVISMGLVGLAALVFPERRPELYRASTTTPRLLGVPVVSIAGAGAIISTVVLWVLYFTEAKLGLSDKQNFFLWIGGTGVLAVLFYYGARFVRRREGIDLDRVYGEIPPE